MVHPTLNLPHDKITDFCRRYHIKTLSLFGSATREDFHPDSDVDVLVEFEEDAKVGLFDLVKMEDELSELFGKRRVDLVTPSIFRNPYRRRAILKDLEQIYAT